MSSELLDDISATAEASYVTVPRDTEISEEADTGFYVASLSEEAEVTSSLYIDSLLEDASAAGHQSPQFLAQIHPDSATLTKLPPPPSTPPAGTVSPNGEVWSATGGAFCFFAGFVLGVIAATDYSRSKAGASKRSELLKRTKSARRVVKSISGPLTEHA